MATVKGHGTYRGQRRGAVDGGNIWWVAPSYKVASKIWRDLKRATKDAWISKNEVERRIEFPNGGAITVWSADDPESLVGDGLDGVVVDEAGKVPKEAWGESLRPALADKQGWALFIGTPKGKNWFSDTFDFADGQPNEKWQRWQLPTWDNPTVTADEIEDMRADMTGAKFAQEIEAKFSEWLGDTFPRDKAIVVTEYPRGISKPVRYWDKAGSEREEGDWTVGAMVGKHDGLYYIVDVVRGRWDPVKRNKVIESTSEMDQAEWGRGRWNLWVEREPGDGGKESAMISARELVAYAPQFETPKKNKETRAEHFAAQWQAGNVRIVKGAWNKMLIDEFAAFPDPDVHDDQVDACSGAFNKLVSTAQPAFRRPVGLAAGARF
jgi:predicted phage terminase large subunit-like protein